MSNYERDLYLTNLILGCDHIYEEFERPYGYGKFDTHFVCIRCNREEDFRYKFSTPDGFFTLWKWAEKQNSWWFEFWHDKWWIEYIEPDKFADAIYYFVKTYINKN